MGQTLSNYTLLVFILIARFCFSQNDGVKPPVIKEYKGDTSYANFNNLRFDVARAQINLLKSGALLVRLKTNINTITKLKAAGNIDLATQVERETNLRNKIIIASYIQEFTFCPVYFFYSNYSDSVKNKSIKGIFLNTNLEIDPTIECKASFYLIADYGGNIYNSSLGIVSESSASKSIERGDPIREVAISIKNRYFIQLHNPFPYFQIKSTSKSILINDPSIPLSVLEKLYDQLESTKIGMGEARHLHKFKGCVFLLNQHFKEYYSKCAGFKVSTELMQYVY
jgi:hypothetical protein